ncbi:TPT-domain-containing protein [Annulohypoxylon truncatum]|uniref:TPT-domain-containing protein n=1 Tax=Annulohypoxylon truncatum TaxID=327061 RepID=UPI002007BA84|nr:TPT-domain-containing protein [Annulohypoxylon truncatum]KAI1215088.1 TPT-domain-containing protein [Annulohypoxylon truncatum]
MTVPLFMKTIVPIGLLYSGSMIFSNLVYLHLSVAFIQMLKATGPIVTLIVGYVWGVEHPSWSKLGYITLIVFGVAMASAGEIQFSWLGSIFQILGILFESLRVIMIQFLLSSKGLDMPPLVLLYYYAPVCAIANFLVSLTSEWSTFAWTHVVEVGPWILISNAILALLLNIFSILLIRSMSALVYVLLGVFKNILLVVSAVEIWNTPITPIQVVGYSLALSGLGLYQSNWELKWEAAAIITALLVIAFVKRGQRNWKDPSIDKTKEGAGHISNDWLSWVHLKDNIWRIGND